MSEQSKSQRTQEFPESAERSRRVDEGSYDGETLSGLNIGMMMDIPGNMGRGNWKAAAFIDERGLKIAAQGVKLVIPSALQFTADRLMNSAGRVGTADNDINAIRNMGMIPQGYTVNHYLTSAKKFFIKTDVPNGLKHFVRAPIKTSMEGDFDTGNVRYKARERYVFGFSDPRGIFGSNAT